MSNTNYIGLYQGNTNLSHWASNCKPNDITTKWHSSDPVLKTPQNYTTSREIKQGQYHRTLNGLGILLEF